jgi:hypothetical protein
MLFGLAPIIPGNTVYVNTVYVYLMFSSRSETQTTALEHSVILESGSQLRRGDQVADEIQVDFESKISHCIFHPVHD